MAKATKTELEAGPKEDQVELNQREKDEGDLFGVRAIEAGFYAGVAQSRPTSRAGSIASNHPAMSSSTLLGGSVNSPLMKGQSNNNSVLSLNLNATKDSTRRASPPAVRLAPSEAELNGRRNHNGAVDMSLQVPPSPGHPRVTSPTFGGSDDGSEGLASPRSMSPQAGQYQQYASVPTASYHAGDENGPKSQTASYNNTPGQSPTPPSPYNPPTAKLPTIPGTALRKESRSPSPENDYPRVQVHEPSR